MNATNASTRRVRGMLVITMAQNTDTTVITEENICGTL